MQFRSFVSICFLQETLNVHPEKGEIVSLNSSPLLPAQCPVETWVVLADSMGKQWLISAEGIHEIGSPRLGDWVFTSKKFTNHHVVATLIQLHRASLSRREPWLECGLKACLPLRFGALLLLVFKCLTSITQMLTSSPSLKDPYRVVQTILQGSCGEKGSRLKTNFQYKEKRPPGKGSKTWIAGQPAAHGGIRYLQVMERWFAYDLRKATGELFLCHTHMWFDTGAINLSSHLSLPPRRKTTLPSKRVGPAKGAKLDSIPPRKLDSHNEKTAITHQGSKVDALVTEAAWCTVWCGCKAQITRTH